MLNHSIVLLRLDGAPMLWFASATPAGPRLTIGEAGSFDGADFYFPREHAERVKRAVEAFQREMQREPVVQAAE